MTSHRKVWSLSLTASFGGFLFGYNVGVFNVAQENVAHTLDWGDDSELLISIGTGLLLFGGLVGSVLLGYLSNHLGRRKALLLTDLVALVAAICMTTPTTSLMIIGRLLSGISAGAFLTVATVYINEMSPPAISGQTGTLFGMQIPFGLLVSSLLGLVLPEETDEDGNEFWMVMFALQLLIIIPKALLLIYAFKVDTPYWYIQHNRIKEAKDAMLDLKRTDPIDALDGQKEDSRSKVALRDFFCSKKYSKLARVGIICAASYPFSGAIFYGSYSTTVFNSVGYSMVMSRLFTGLSFFADFVGMFLVLGIINKVGRKKLYLTGLGVVTVCLALTCIFIGVYEVPILVVSISFIYKVGLAVSIESVALLYISEILNSKEAGVVYGFVWLIDAFIGFISLYSIEWLGLAGNIGIYSALTGAIMLFMSFQMIETSHKPRDHIEMMYLNQNPDDEQKACEKSFDTPCNPT